LVFERIKTVSVKDINGLIIRSFSSTPFGTFGWRLNKDLMDKNQENINRLMDRMNQLLSQQEAFTKEVNAIRTQLDQLVLGQFDEVKTPEKVELEPTHAQLKEDREEVVKKSVEREVAEKPSKTRLGWEKFIGENLINKIGIAVTVIGVSIGAKYAIDNELISPLMRILLGCLVGFSLIGVGYYLKKNFEKFSAVLVSGGIAILYFMTFLGYDLYQLMPMQVAFGLMVILTAYAIKESISYSQEPLSIIALVGAYAVPFLLSDGTGNVKVLFTYMIIINLGILFLSFKRSGKILYYSAFGLSWLVFAGWLVDAYYRTEPLAMTMIVSSIFFLIFYMTFLAFKLVHSEKFGVGDVVLVLMNCFIYYLICYICMSLNETAQDFIGLFTLGNAFLHIGIAYLIKQRTTVDRNIYYLVAGLAMTFITISIPAQLDGNWVTLLWAGQTVILFWIGRVREVVIYEKLAFVMMVITLGSLMQDWSIIETAHWGADLSELPTPFLSLSFFTSMIVVASFAYVYYLHHKHLDANPFQKAPETQKLINAFLPILVIVSAYYTVYLEIDFYWNQKIAKLNGSVNEMGETQYTLSDNLRWYKSTWLICYSLFFGAGLVLFNQLKSKSQSFGTVLFVITSVLMIAFLTGGLYALSELRDYYLEMLQWGKQASVFRLVIRYLILASAAINLFVFYRMLQQDFMKGWRFSKGFDLILFTTILWVSSSELIHWLTMYANAGNYKLEVSILWGVYSLVFVSIGIWLKKQHYRMAAISLFGLTLAKLFLYDISHLSTISKTIVFVSLGILLLIISFLYNKFKHLMEEEK
jgi:uncharacterized membrane protein